MEEPHIDNEMFLSTGCSKLDSFLRGGLPRKGITQIYGESGTGKTQLALQFCLSAQIPKNSTDVGGVAYICTEAAFPSSRLHELFKKSPLVKDYAISNEKIFIEHISNTEGLEDCIFQPDRLPTLLSMHKIKLLIIDSIAATYRVEYDLMNVKSRAKSLRKVGYQLQKLSKIHEMAVVCINQVTAMMGNNYTENLSCKEQPSLGITWASMVTNSFYLYKKFNRRYLFITGSPYLPRKNIEYEIIESGIIGKDP
ncbi:DNA repair protein XRCC3 [Nasonia vitripennis]|uniref:RecA family profile 1 domain-containing protein n=1 Tax=Nasonia vitripennis TaxID=7425 RepID=A0A7M7LKR2_NASVI|nr:DNA repair protein XRCC3 [Nasonia vitripennis]